MATEFTELGEKVLNRDDVGGPVKSIVMPIVMPDASLEGEVEQCDPDDFTTGDYVTRDGTDIHYVEEHDSDMITVVCIVAPSHDWAKPGELEDNLTRRYSRINRHFLPFAKSEHEKLKTLFPDGWVY